VSDDGSIAVVAVGDDDSAGGAEAISFSARLAAQLGAEVVLVRAYSPLDELKHAAPPVDFKQLEQATRDRLETERAAPLREAGVVYRVMLVEDPDAIGVLARAAKECGADLVVVGSHGKTGWRARVLGNVATKLPLALSCPITIVPAPASR
jgi:nucleotide-binding universal stress UspA family protein